MKITFFGTQPYDRESFDRANASFGFEFNYHRSHLNGNNALLAQGADAVCIFVNDTADAGTIRQLAGMGVKLIALRCAGFNNVDLNAAARKPPLFDGSFCFTMSALIVTPRWSACPVRSAEAW